MLAPSKPTFTPNLIAPARAPHARMGVQRCVRQKGPGYLHSANAAMCAADALNRWSTRAVCIVNSWRGCQRDDVADSGHIAITSAPCRPATKNTARSRRIAKKGETVIWQLPKQNAVTTRCGGKFTRGFIALNLAVAKIAYGWQADREQAFLTRPAPRLIIRLFVARLTIASQPAAQKELSQTATFV